MNTEGVEVIEESKKSKSENLARYRSDLVTFAEERFYVYDTKKLIRFHTFQREYLREALSLNPDGSKKYQFVVWGTPKKHAKTLITAVRAIHQALTPNQEIYLLAGSKDQAQSRCFKMVEGHLDLSNYPEVRHKTNDSIVFANGSFIQVVPNNPNTIAGSNPDLVLITEAWSYTLGRHRVILDEMTIPAEKALQGQTWLDSYASFTDSGSILYKYYKEIVEDNTPIDHPLFPDVFYVDGRRLYIYDQKSRIASVTPAYLKHQRSVLEPANFARIHLNQFVSSTYQGDDDITVNENIDESKLDGGSFYMGVDGSVSADYTSICVIKVKETYAAEVETIVVVPPIWFKGINAEIDDLCEKYDIRAIFFDPYQLASSMESRLNAIPVNQVKERMFFDHQTNVAVRKGFASMIPEGQVSKSFDQATFVVKDVNIGRYTKSMNTSKIDPLVAYSMAYGGSQMGDLKIIEKLEKNERRIRKHTEDAPAERKIIRNRSQLAAVSKPKRDPLQEAQQALGQGGSFFVADWNN